MAGVRTLDPWVTSHYYYYVSLHSLGYCPLYPGHKWNLVKIVSIQLHRYRVIIKEGQKLEPWVTSHYYYYVSLHSLGYCPLYPGHKWNLVKIVSIQLHRYRVIIKEGQKLEPWVTSQYYYHVSLHSLGYCPLYPGRTFLNSTKYC